MTCCNDVADYDWLTGTEAAVLLVELSASSESLHTLTARLRRHLTEARTHLVVEQLELRKRATAKFAHAERMFFTRVGLEQATDQWVAEYKASRLAGRGPLADLCCGIGGDLLALAERGEVIAVDRSAVAIRLAAANVAAVLSADCAERVTLQMHDIEGFRASDARQWHIDPDRRPAGHRTTSLAWCSPDATCLERLLGEVPNAAVKLAPAADVPDDWNERCELEWIGRDRQCRQLVAWHGALAKSPGLRRATVLTETSFATGGVAGVEPKASPQNPSRARSIVGRPNQPIPITDCSHRFVLDPDPAVRAARLTGALAAEHNLAALAAGPTYLTGDQPVADAALACFQVDDVLPLRIRSLAAYLRERQVGQLEIKKRGVDVDPERLRRDLKLRGDRAATLLLGRVGGKQAAIVARRRI